MAGPVTYLFDPKPELTKRSGEEYQGEITYSFVNRAVEEAAGEALGSLKNGAMWYRSIGQLLPHFAEIVDDVCLIRSMHTGHNGHEVSIRYFHAGIPAQICMFPLCIVDFVRTGIRDKGSTIVRCRSRAYSVDAVNNWSNGWLPSIYQGTVVRREPRISNLDPPSDLQGSYQSENLALLKPLNQRHLSRKPGEADLSKPGLPAMRPQLACKRPQKWH